MDCPECAADVASRVSRCAKNDWSGIRTHASEETSALNWRLRPLGHPTVSCAVLVYSFQKQRSFRRKITHTGKNSGEGDLNSRPKDFSVTTLQSSALPLSYPRLCTRCKNECFLSQEHEFARRCPLLGRRNRELVAAVPPSSVGRAQDF